jgi:AraC family transcriptional regulator
VCFGVGYNSMGSFTREFTRLVGLPPTSLRRLAQDTSMYCQERLRDYEADPCHGAAPGARLVGQISGPVGFSGFIFVGLFATPIPQGRPVGCALLSSVGPYRISGVPDGAYHLFAAAFPRSGEPLAYLLPDQSNMYVGASHDRLLIYGDTVKGDADVTLRPLQLTDPPILVALPLLMVEHQSTHEMAMA